MAENVDAGRCKEERDEIKGLVTASEARQVKTTDEIKIWLSEVQTAFNKYKDEK